MAQAPDGPAPRPRRRRDTDWRCREGYSTSSYGCSECEPTHYRFGRRCVRCPTDEADFAWTLMLLSAMLALALVVFVSLACSRRREYPSAVASLLVGHLQLLSVVSTMLFPWPAELAEMLGAGSYATLHPNVLACPRLAPWPDSKWDYEVKEKDLWHPDICGV